jgi:hypothetical protein
MNKEIEKLKVKIEEIDGLKSERAWGVKFRLWLNLTEKLVKKIFGDEGLKLFNQQGSVVLTDEAYIQELDSRKEMLNGLLSNQNEYQPKKQSEPVAIKVIGKLKGVRIENNVSYGKGLLEADEIEDSSVVGNKAFSPQPESDRQKSKLGFLERITNNQTAAIVIGAMILAVLAFFIYKFTGYRPSF